MEIRQLRVAGKGHAAAAALLLIHPRPRNLAPVRANDGVVDEHERGPRVRDGGAGVLVPLHGAIADGVALRGELPETLRRVDGDVVDLTVELRRVDAAELVGADSGVAQVSREDGLREAGLDVVEEGFLGGGLDGVDGAEAEANEAVGVDVLDEAVGDVGGELDGLLLDLCASNVDGVEANGPLRLRRVAVRNGE